MKESSKLSIKEKAKRYDEILARAEGANLPYYKEEIMSKVKEFVDYLLPELKESEDERIRKAIYNCVEWFGFDSRFFRYASQKDCLTWIKKQGEQDNNEDSNILQRFSFYSYKDEPNILYLAGVYVNEEYRNKGIGTKILKVADEVAKNLNCHTIRLKTKKNSDAERLYRTHGYNSLTTEESDEIWLEKQSEHKCDCKHVGCHVNNIKRWCYKKQSEILYEKCNTKCSEYLNDGKTIDFYQAVRDLMNGISRGEVYSPESIADELLSIAKKSIKQYEQKSTDKDNSKFNVGDWVVSPNGVYWHIDAIRNGRYQVSCNSGEGADWPLDTNIYHRFTIKDAKDGDVLASNNSIFIFHQEYIAEKPEAYCGIMNGLFIVKSESCWTNEKCYPATKEQRNILKKAMTNKGYTFDFKNKELKITDWSKHIKYKNPSIIEKMIAWWSEEDEKMLEDIKFNFEYNKEKMTDALIAQYNRFFDKIKSLKSQLKQGWSEEDEKMFEKCINIASGYYYLQEDRNDVKDWLKSIKLRSNRN